MTDTGRFGDTGAEMAPRREEAGPEGQAGCFLGELANRDEWGGGGVVRSGWVRKGPVEWVPGSAWAAPGALLLPWQMPSRSWVLRTALISPRLEPLKGDMGP